MNLEKIPFEKVKKEVLELFSTCFLDNWSLLPDDIDKIASSTGIKLEWDKIDWWDSFEKGNANISIDTFYHILFEKIMLFDSKAIIVTDECFIEKSAYRIDFSDMKLFLKTIYPQIHQMEFFQPQDYIFLFPNDKHLTILHHEGLITQYQKS